MNTFMLVTFVDLELTELVHNINMWDSQFGLHLTVKGKRTSVAGWLTETSNTLILARHVFKSKSELLLMPLERHAPDYMIRDAWHVIGECLLSHKVVERFNDVSDEYMATFDEEQKFETALAKPLTYADLETFETIFREALETVNAPDTDPEALDIAGMFEELMDRWNKTRESLLHVQQIRSQLDDMPQEAILNFFLDHMERLNKLKPETVEPIQKPKQPYGLQPRTLNRLQQALEIRQQEIERLGKVKTTFKAAFRHAGGGYEQVKDAMQELYERWHDITYDPDK